jgi:D-alanyl-D-alanine carboxypeptidase (penicillin-binding protein 5/6)
MNSDSQSKQLQTPVRRTDSSVQELMTAWRVKKPAYTLASAVHIYLIALLLILALTLVLSSVLFICAHEEYFNFDLSYTRPTTDEQESENSGGVANNDGERPFADGVNGNVLLPWSDNIKIIPEDHISSSYAALADLATGEIIASRKADETIYPASMTKVMTLIVIAENLPDEECLKDEIIISEDIYMHMKAEGASGIGMEAGETLTVESLLYALMLRSDGIAACELARYVAGSEEDFVELMNQKAEKMGLSNTHFENPTGLFHQNHRSTAREIASIMAYAMNMKLCRKILLAQFYQAPCVGADGAKFNYNIYHNLVVTKFEEIPVNQPSAIKVAAGKTGFTDEARYCLVTYAESSDGHGYVCVTAKGESYNACIADYITIYNTYAKP